MANSKISARSFIAADGAYEVGISIGGGLSRKTTFNSILDLVFFRPDANTREQRNSTTTQVFRVYDTYTDDSNYRRISLSFTGARYTIEGERAGSAGHVDFQIKASQNLLFLAASSVHFKDLNDSSSLSIGYSTTRPTLFFGGSSDASIERNAAANQLLFDHTIIVKEAGSNPSAADLTSGADAKDRLARYMRNDKLVFAYNNGGVVTYLSIPLDGSATTWTHGTSAP